MTRFCLTLSFAPGIARTKDCSFDLLLIAGILCEQSVHIKLLCLRVSNYLEFREHDCLELRPRQW